MELNPYAIPGSFGSFFIGEALDLYNCEQLFFWSRHLKYGSRFKTNVLGNKTLVVSSPDAYNTILIEKANSFSNNMGWKTLEPFLGRGILLEDGSTHQHVRRLVNPLFHSKMIAKYMDIIFVTTQRKIDERKGKSSKLYIILKDYTLAIILQILFGKLDQSVCDYVGKQFDILLRGLRDWARLPLLPVTDFGKAFIAKGNLLDFISKEIQNRNSSYDDTFVIADSLKQSVTANDLTLEKASELALQLLFAGHETSINTLFWSINLLNYHVEVRYKLTQEVLSSEDEGSIIKGTPYLSAVINETQRLYPPIFFIPRGVIEETVVDDIVVPSGWHVNLSPLYTHRSPRYFSQPLRFHPDRFILNSQPHDQFTFINFGGGQHFCLGSELARLEIKAFLYYLMRSNWEVYPIFQGTEVVNTYKELNKYSLYLI
jgi:retinoid hydroxylase